MLADVKCTEASRCRADDDDDDPSDALKLFSWCAEESVSVLLLACEHTHNTHTYSHTKDH